MATEGFGNVHQPSFKIAPKQNKSSSTLAKNERKLLLSRIWHWCHLPWLGILETVLVFIKMWTAKSDQEFSGAANMWPVLCCVFWLVFLQFRNQDLIISFNILLIGGECRRWHKAHITVDFCVQYSPLGCLPSILLSPSPSVLKAKPFNPSASNISCRIPWFWFQHDSK